MLGGATKSISFLLSKDSPGRYSVAIGGREAILKVWQPMPTGTFFARILRGKARLEVQNRYSDLDALVVLSEAAEPTTPWVAFYVQSGDKYTVDRIVHTVDTTAPIPLSPSSVSTSN